MPDRFASDAAIPPPSTEWELRDAPPALDPSAVHVWRVSVERARAALPRLASLLADTERSRAARYRHPGDRDRLIVGRASLRRLLAAYTGAAPSAVALTIEPGGKPALAGAHDHAFNVSHSGEWILIACARSPVGVDVEEVRPRAALLALARRFFSRDEIAWLEAVKEDQQEAAFYACWTRKEAVIKLCGDGLRTPLAGFSVGARADGALQLRFSGRSDVQAWQVYDLAPAPGYAGALVTGRPMARIQLFELDNP